MTARDPVAAARALLEKATPGPWGVWKGHAQVFAGPVEENTTGCLRGYRGLICECGEDEPDWGEAQARRNAKLIAAAPALLGELAAEVERLRGENDRPAAP